MTRGWRDRIVPDRPGPLLLSGILLGLAHPPFHLLVPSFVALVPYLIWLEGLPKGPEGGREARKGGYFLGLIYYTLVFYWLLVALVFYTPLAILAFLAPILILSGFLAIMTLGVWVARHRMGWPPWLAFPVFWTANEWFRANLPEVGFPWMQLGDTLSAFPWLIGAADLVGSRGLSFWLAAVNALIAMCIWTGWKRESGAATRIVRLGTVLAVVVVIPIAYSLQRWNTLELRPAVTVGVVQPNVPEHLKVENPNVAADSAIRSTETLIRPWVGREDLDLVLLPETALQAYLEPIPSMGYRGAASRERWAAGVAAVLDSDVLVGALGSRDLGDSAYVGFNSAFQIRPGQGRLRRYDKRFLVPMVERVPFVPPEWLSWIPFMGDFGVGALQAPLDVGGTNATYGVMICYESIFSPLGRHYRNAGADFLVNITNDAWFGRDAWWSRSSALWQHPAHLVMRAVEARMGVARSANTGISQIVDPLGRISHATPLFEPAAFVGQVETTDGRTVYVRVGDVAGWAAAFAALFVFGAAVRRRRKEGRSSEASRDDVG